MTNLEKVQLCLDVAERSLKWGGLAGIHDACIAEAKRIALLPFWDGADESETTAEEDHHA